MSKSQDNIDHMHQIVQFLTAQLHHMLEIAREEFDGEDLNGYDGRMVDAFARAALMAGQAINAMHTMIDQDFEPVTEEDVVEAFRKRLGFAHNRHALEPQLDTRGEVPLSELPDWDAETFDPGKVEERRENLASKPTYTGRHQHQSLSDLDLSVSPEERGETT